MTLPFLHQQTYPFAVACDAAGIQLNTLKAWIKRKNITFSEQEMERANKAGEPHRLTYSTVIRLAIMGKLVKFGMAPSNAWLAALTYTLAGGIMTGSRETTRMPGELFKTGQTWLVVQADGSSETINLQIKEPASFLAIHAREAIVLLMNPFIADLDKKLSELAERSAA